MGLQLLQETCRIAAVLVARSCQVCSRPDILKFIKQRLAGAVVHRSVVPALGVLNVVAVDPAQHCTLHIQYEIGKSISGMHAVHL